MDLGGFGPALAGVAAKAILMSVRSGYSGQCLFTLFLDYCNVHYLKLSLKTKKNSFAKES